MSSAVVAAVVVVVVVEVRFQQQKPLSCLAAAATVRATAELPAPRRHVGLTHGHIVCVCVYKAYI